MAKVHQEKVWGDIEPSKLSITANFNLKPPVWNQTSAKGKCILFLYFDHAALCIGYSYTENKTCSENSMTRAFKGRVSEFKRSLCHDKKVKFLNQDVLDNI